MSVKKFFINVFMLILPLVTFAGNSYKVVSTRNLNVRNAPSIQSVVVGSLAPASVISVIEIKDGWAKIIYNGKECYVSSSYISKVVEEKPDDQEPVVDKVIAVPESETSPESGSHHAEVDNKKIRKKFKKMVATTLFKEPAFQDFLDKEVNAPFKSGNESVESQFNIAISSGMANLAWDQGHSVPTATFGARAEFRHHFSVDKWSDRQLCSNVSVGLQMKGAKALVAPCMVLELQPIGFSFPVSLKDFWRDGKISCLAGVYAQMGLRQICVDGTNYGVNPGFGFCVTSAFELPHWNFSISYERGLNTFIDSSLNLHDYCIMLSVSRTIFSF